VHRLLYRKYQDGEWHFSVLGAVAKVTLGMLNQYLPLAGYGLAGTRLRRRDQVQRW